jgi:hypothetical protein
MPANGLLPQSTAINPLRARTCGLTRPVPEMPYSGHDDVPVHAIKRVPEGIECMASDFKGALRR